MNGVKWSARELARLVVLREESKLKWHQISAALPGRTTSACTLAFYGIAAKRRREEARAAARAVSPPPIKIRCIVPLAPVLPPPAPRLLPAPSPFVRSTFALRADAELRARIEALGLTAGLFGDPPPGRSALDKKRAGEISTATITLPMGPLR